MSGKEIPRHLVFLNQDRADANVTARAAGEPWEQIVTGRNVGSIDVKFAAKEGIVGGESRGTIAAVAPITVT